MKILCKYKKQLFLFILCSACILQPEAQSFTFSTQTEAGDTTSTSFFFSVKSPKFKFNYVREIIPSINDTLTALCITPVPQLSFYAGNIVTGGLYSRAETPYFSSFSPITRSTIPALSLNLTLPTLSSSKKTAEGLGFEAYMHNSTVYAYSELNANHKPSKLLFGLRFYPQNTGFSISFSAGIHHVKTKENNNWFRNYHYITPQTLRFILAEASFTHKKFKLFFSGALSESPSGKTSGYLRLQEAYEKKFFIFNSGIFLCTPDYYTFDGTILRKVFSAYINPQVSFSFKNDEHKLQFGIIGNITRQYSFGHSSKENKECSISTKLLYANDFTTFSTMVKYVPSAYKSIFKSDDTQAVCTYNFSISLYPVMLKRKQTLTFETELKKYPFNKEKEESVKFDSTFKFSPASNILVSTSYSLKAQTNLSAHDYKTVKSPFSDNKYQFSEFTFTTYAKYTLPKFSSKPVLTFKTSVKQELNKKFWNAQNRSSLFKTEIFFNIGFSLCIKP